MIQHEQQIAQRNWQDIAVGSTLCRNRRQWTVIKHTRRETSVEVHMVCGRRHFKVNVMVGAFGPSLWETGLQLVRSAPAQVEMRL